VLGVQFPLADAHSCGGPRARLICVNHFVVSALWMAYEQFQEPMYLSMAVSAAEYVLSSLLD